MSPHPYVKAVGASAKRIYFAGREQGPPKRIERQERRLQQLGARYRKVSFGGHNLPLLVELWRNERTPR